MRTDKVIKMKIAVCDDDPGFLNLVRKELEEYYKSLDVGVMTFTSGAKLLRAVKEMPFIFMCIFLDIEMPHMSGFQTALQIRKINSQIPILLLTSHTEYAMKGYEVQAFRFLRKPLEREVLYRSLEAVERQHIQRQRITILQNGCEIYLPVSDILYIKSENVYLSIHVRGEGRSHYLVRKKLKEQKKELPGQLFCQVHRSYLVNLGQVRSFDGKQVWMTDGMKIPVSRKNKESFQTAMSRYLRELASG